MDRKIALILFLFFLVLYSSTFQPYGYVNWNEGSRLATVQSLVEEGTLVIDNTVFVNNTGDKAFVNGHFYSDKAPGMALLTVPFYWILFQLGFSFAEHQSYLIPLLIFPFTALAATAPAIFFLASRHYTSNLRARLLTSLALGAGTAIFVYADVFISHSATAALILLSFYFSLKAKEDKRWLWLSGVFGGLATLLEYPAALLFFAILGNYYYETREKRVVFAGIAWLPFVLFILAYNYGITGNALDSPYNYVHAWEGSYFGEDMNAPKVTRITPNQLSLMLVGGMSPTLGGLHIRGLLLYTPFLLLGFWTVRKQHWILLGSCVALLFFYAMMTEAMGGGVYSNRFMVVALPFLVLPSLVFAEKYSRTFAIVASVSAIISFLGANTWPFMMERFPLGKAIIDFASYPVSNVVTALLTAFIVFSLVWMGFKEKKSQLAQNNLHEP